MATSSDSAGPNLEPHRQYDSAAKFVRGRLADADGPLSPKELADEYECGSHHMRRTTSNLAQEGVIERVSRGQYVLADDDRDTEPDTEVSVPLLSGPDEEGDHTEEQGESTNESEQDDMPTDAEYQQQHAEGNDGESDESEQQDTADNERTANDAEQDGVSDSAAVGLPAGVDPRTLMLLVGVAAVAYVVYRSVSGSGSGSGQSGGDEEPVEESSGDDWPGGGLVE